MIQRIQTIYLLAAALFTGSLYFTPFMFVQTEKIMYTDSLTFTILISVIVLVSLVNIFCYKNRIIQMRLAMISTLVLLGFQGWIAYIFFTTDAAFSTTALFPLLSAIFSLLAFRGIARDEALVQSADRLRSVRKNKTSK